MQIKRTTQRRHISHLAFGAGACFFIALPAVRFWGQQAGLNSQARTNGTPQTGSPALMFDVASVRETKPAVSYFQRLFDPPHNSSFIASSLWIDQVIGEAYNVDYSYQIIGGPDWIKSQRFDIQAKADTAVDDQLRNMSDEQGRAAKHEMLQQLLADRFKLKVHKEIRQAPTFVLRTTRKPPKLQESHEASVTTGTHISSTHGILSSGGPSGIELRGDQASMKQLTGLLGFYLRTPVVDQTALKGTYSFDLQFHGQRSDFQDDDASKWPPIETAVPEQLGLALVLTKGPVEIIVIDSIEKPTAN